MNYSDVNLNLGKPKWLLQSISDLGRMEGFREFPYPDPLSVLGRRYASPKYGWGMSPADALLVKYGEKAIQGEPWTIGYGETKNITPASRTTKQLSDKQLESDILNDCVPVLDKLTPKWKDMPLFAQTTLINLAYNLGLHRLAQFTGTLQAFNAGQWVQAGEHLRDSLWYKEVGARGVELVARMKTQSIDPKYLVV